MGNSHLCELRQDQDSIAEPGQRCITSGPLEDLDPPISLSEVLDEADIFYRNPLLAAPELEDRLKSLELHDHGPDDFTVKVTLDGEKLDALGEGRGDGMHKVIVWTRCIVDRRRMVIQSLNYVQSFGDGVWLDEASDENVVFRIVEYGLGPPDRVELLIDIMGLRKTDEQMCAGIHAIFDKIARARQLARDAKVQVRHGARSIKEVGTVSNVSAPIDEEDLTFEDLFKSMLGILQAGVANSKREFWIDANGEAPAADSLEAFIAQEPPKVRRGIRRDVAFEQQRGEIKMLEIAIAEDGKVAWPSWSRVRTCIIHKDPLVVESWTEDSSGGHTSSAWAARKLQEWINLAIEKVPEMHEKELDNLGMDVLKSLRGVLGPGGCESQSLGFAAGNFGHGF